MTIDQKIDAISLITESLEILAICNAPRNQILACTKKLNDLICSLDADFVFMEFGISKN